MRTDSHEDRQPRGPAAPGRAAYPALAGESEDQEAASGKQGFSSDGFES